MIQVPHRSTTTRLTRAARLGVLALALLGVSACKDSTSSRANPVPVLQGRSPAAGNSGATDFTFTLLGQNFVKGSKVRWAGTDISTKFVGKGQLQATVPTALLANPGSYPVSVFNPAPGGGTSGSINFVLK